MVYGDMWVTSSHIVTEYFWNVQKHTEPHREMHNNSHYVFVKYLLQTQVKELNTHSYLVFC